MPFPRITIEVLDSLRVSRALLDFSRSVGAHPIAAPRRYERQASRARVAGITRCSRWHCHRTEWFVSGRRGLPRVPPAPRGGGGGGAGAAAPRRAAAPGGRG